MLAAMEAHAAPCGAKAVIAELAPMVALYGVPDRSREEWATFWRFYTDLLGKLSLEAVKAGVAAYVAKPDAEFFPKPGPLAALCKDTHDRLFMAAHRLRIACAAKQPEEVGARDPDAYRRHLSEVSLAIWTERKEQAA